MATCNPTFMSCKALSSPSAESCFGGAVLTNSSRLQTPKTSRFGVFLQFSERVTGKMTSSERRRQLPRNLSVSSAMDVPDFLPAAWSKGRAARPIGPSFDLTAEDATLRQLDALQINDQPYADHGVEVMYRFAGFDPFQRSKYFGTTFDLGQFERFRRIFHHSTYRSLLSHKERRILSSLYLDEHLFKQRVWIGGARPGEEEIFEFTLVQRVGGNWDGYWLTDSLLHDGPGITGGIAY